MAGVQGGDHRGHGFRRALTQVPIVLFIDRVLDPAPFADALGPRLACRERVAPQQREAVVALVTSSEPVALGDVLDYPGLRVVLTCSTGTDHLDIEGLRARGINVFNTPTYCSEEVADHALACVLAGWRGLWRLDRGVRAGRWDASAVLRRFDAQRLGIVGLGRIGTALARRAVGLGIEVVGHDPVAPPPEGVQMLSLEDLLASSDAVSLHMPAVPGAPPILGAGQLALMKPDALLVNLARAALVDLDAMLDALAGGRLGAAAWDVWPAEPPDADDRLLTPGLLVTPHVAWSSPQAQVGGQLEAIETLRSCLLAGGP